MGVNVNEKVKDVRRKMLSGDKQQAFVSGDVQPGREVQTADVKDRDGQSDTPRPPLGSTPRR